MICLWDVAVMSRLIGAGTGMPSERVFGSRRNSKDRDRRKACLWSYQLPRRQQGKVFPAPRARIPEEQVPEMDRVVRNQILMPKKSAEDYEAIKIGGNRDG